jgi:hypothetical protein
LHNDAKESAMIQLGYKLCSEEHGPADLAGYDHVWVHQVGPEQEGFFRFYEREVIPKLAARRPKRKAA